MSNLAYIPNDYARGYVTSRSDNRKGVHLPLSFIDICDGNLHDAILFAQIMYWHEPSKDTGQTRLKKQDDGHLWLFKNHAEWYAECRIKPATVRKCLERLKAAKLIEYKVGGAIGNPTPYMRVNWAVFETKMKAWELEQLPPENVIMLPDTTGHTPVPAGHTPLIQQDIPLSQQDISNTENTTETTSKNTKKKKESSTPAGIDAAPIDYDKLLDEIGITFKAHGSEAKLVATLLMGTSKAKGWLENKLDVPMNHTELKAYRQWYQTVYSDRTMVKKPIKINSSVQEWRTSPEYQAYIKQAESVNVSSAPVPTMTALDHKHAPEWIAAQPDYGTPEENTALDRMFADLVTSKRSTKLVGKIPPTLRDVS
jgi:hypothetical protein